MAGRRRFARDAVTSTGCWCFIVLALGGCRGVLAVDSAIAVEPNAAVPRGEERGCYRPLSDVIWGFLVTLFALTVSMWGSYKHAAEDTKELGVAMVFGIFALLYDLLYIVDTSIFCVSVLWNCHKMEYPDSRITSSSWLKFLCSSLFPWSKCPTRILASCDIVVYLSKESPLLQKTWLWRSTNTVNDESEAMVVGENGARAIRNHQYVRKELSLEGIDWLVWKEVFCGAKDSKCLPKYDELKYLRGNSGFAVIAIAIQAFGYIYAVGFRSAKNLRVSPLEVIGLIFNIILLMKVFLYSTCNCCHRPLVIYMDKDWEQEISGDFINYDQEMFERYDSKKLVTVILFCIFVVLGTLLVYYIVHMVNSTNVMVGVPVILFLVGLGLVPLEIFLLSKGVDMQGSIFGLGCLLTAVSYVWALVGTILYWRTMHFNTRGDLTNLSQIIPFIG